MSKLELNEANEKNFQEGFLRDAYFLYASIKEPRLKYKSNTEYVLELQACIDEDTADAWEEIFKANKVHKFTKEKFEETFKCDAPFDAKKQYVVKFTVDYKGEDMPELAHNAYKRTKVWEKTAAGKMKDITLEKLVGNGTLGDVSFYISRPKEGGAYPKMTGLLVKDLVEYVDNGGAGGCAFGETEEAPTPFTEDEAEEQAPDTSEFTEDADPDF